MTTSPAGPTACTPSKISTETPWITARALRPGAHVATIQAGLVAHHRAAQPADQLHCGYVIYQKPDARHPNDLLEASHLLGDWPAMKPKKSLVWLKPSSSWRAVGSVAAREGPTARRMALSRP